MSADDGDAKDGTNPADSQDAASSNHGTKRPGKTQVGVGPGPKSRPRPPKRADKTQPGLADPAGSGPGSIDDDDALDWSNDGDDGKPPKSRPRPPVRRSPRSEPPPRRKPRSEPPPPPRKPRPDTAPKKPKPPLKPRAAAKPAEEIDDPETLDIDLIEEVDEPKPPQKPTPPRKPRPPRNPNKKAEPAPKDTPSSPERRVPKAQPANPKSETPALGSAMVGGATPSPGPVAAMPKAKPRAEAPKDATPPPAPSFQPRRADQVLLAEVALDPAPARAARLQDELGRLSLADKDALQHFNKALRHLEDYRPSMRGARRLRLRGGDVAGATALFDAEIALAKDGREKAALTLAKAYALLDGGKAKEARAAFLQAVELDPSWLTGLEALGLQAVAQKDHAQLADVLGKAAAVLTDDQHHRAAVLTHRARLLHRRLGKPEAAVDALHAALQLDARTPVALAALKRLLFAQSRWRDLVAAHEMAASLTTDPALQTWSWWTIGRLHEQRLGLKDDAAKAFEHAARITPKSPHVLEDLVQLYAELGQRKGQADALERLASAVARPADKLSVYMRLGRLFDGADGDPSVAARWYEAALAIEAAHPPALFALDLIYQARGAHLERAAIFARAGEAPVASSRRADAHVRAAAIYDEALDQPDRAVDHYQKALSLEPGRTTAFNGLVRLLVGARRYAELVEVYDRAVDRAESEDIAISYLFKIASLHEDVMRDIQLAVATYERILARDPKHLGALHALQRAAVAAGEVDKAVAAYDAEAELTQESGRRVELEHRAAVLVQDGLGDLEQARKRFEVLGRRAPKHLPTLQSLSRIYHRLERYADELETLERQLAITDEPAETIALLVELGQLCETRLAEPKRAIPYFRRASEADPDHPVAGGALQRLLRKVGEHQALAQVLAKELATARGRDRQFQLALELGDIYETELGKPDDAIAAYRRALAAYPGHSGAAEDMHRVLAAEGRWKELDEALITQSQAERDERLATDEKVRAALLRADRLNRVDDAVALLEEVAAEHPRNVTALVALEHLYAAQQDDESLGTVWQRKAEVLLQPEARVASLYHRGRALAAAGDDEALRSVCTAIIAIVPRHEWALSTMAELAERNEDKHLRADMASRRTEVETEPSLAALAQMELGDALRRLNPSASLAAYRTSTELDAERLLPIRGIYDVGYALGDITMLIESFQKEAKWLADDDAAADLLVQSASMQARQGEWQGAIDDAEAALRRSPDHGDAAQQLEALLIRTGMQERLIEQLTQAAHAARKTPRRVALWRQVGQLYANEKGDLGAAISAVGRALEAAPKEVETLRQLAGLHLLDKQFEEAAELLTRAVELEPKNVEAHTQLARIYTEHRPDAAKAQRSLDVVLAARPDDPGVLAMQLKAHLLAGDRERTRMIGEGLLAAAGDDVGMKAWALTEIGRAELSAGQGKGAADVLRQAVVIEGPEGGAAELYRKMIGSEVSEADYAGAIAAHLRDNPKASAQVYLDLARLQIHKLKATADAFSTLDQGLARHPDSPDLLLERAELQLNSGRTAEANALFRRIALERPREERAWRGMVRSLQQLGLPSEASLAAGALVVLGTASEVEVNLSQERGLRPGSARPGALGHPTLRAVSVGSREAEDRLAEMFAVHADGISKSFPPHYESYGVRRGDRIKARAPHPVRATIDRLVPVFGVEEFELFVHAGMGGDVTIELSTPPAIMVPASVADMDEAQQVFLLARGLAGVASGLYPALRLSPEDTAAVVAAAVRRLVPSFEDGYHDAQRLAMLQQQLSPSWFGRGRVDEVVQRYYAEPTDVREWAPTVKRSVTRVAALLAGDLGACLEALRAVGDVEGDGPEVLEQNEVVRDLLTFWVSDEAMEVRRLAGIL